VAGDRQWLRETRRPTSAAPLVPTPVYALESEVQAAADEIADAIDGIADDLAATDTALASKSNVGHTHSGTAVTITDPGWSGLLAGSGVTTLQELADFLDANLRIL
jgi:hypothetical protein